MTSGFAESNQLSKAPVYLARQNAQRVPDAVLAPGREAIQRGRVAMEQKLYISYRASAGTTATKMLKHP